MAARRLLAGALLFVPAEERRLAKIAQLEGAGALVIDLEDAIAPSAKPTARSLAAAAVRTVAPGPFLAVRVNNDPGLLDDDLEAVVGDRVDCVMLPKTESPDQVTALATRLSALEAKRGLADGRTGIVALVETARGVTACEAIAVEGSGRLLTLAVGPGDLSADLGLPPDGRDEGLLHARSRVVLAARAGGLAGAIDGPYPHIRDLAGLVENSRRSHRLGFRGRLVLHPDHVGPVDEAYGALGPAELDFALRVVASFEEQAEQGKGVVVVDDALVDLPVYERYRQLLELHGAR